MRRAVVIEHDTGVDIGRTYTLCLLTEGYGDASRFTKRSTS